MWKLKNRFIALVVTFLVVMAGFGIGSAVADGSIDGNSTIDDNPVSSNSIDDTTVDDTIVDDTTDYTTVDETIDETTDDTTAGENVDQNVDEETTDETIDENINENVDDTTVDDSVDENIDETADGTTVDETTDDTTVDENVDDKVSDDTNDQTSDEEKVVDEEDEEVVCETPTEEICEEAPVCEAPKEEVICETPTEDIKCVETSPQAVDPCVKVNNTTGQVNISSTDEPKENTLGNFIKSVLDMFNGNNSSERTLEQTTVQNAGTPADQNLTIHFLDVGQGDSILIECNNSTMLIDAGESDQGEIVSDYLQNQGISTLDYVVATHPHSDHIGSMSDIINGFQIDHFIDSGYPHTTQTYEDMLTIIDQKDIPFEVAQAGQTIDFDPAVDIEVLNPGTTYSDDLNENSVVFKINYGDTSFLLMGDAGLETEENIMKAGYDINSDILKVGHHGSQSSSGETFISTVSPEVSVIEVGAENDYGHPDSEILERLQTASKVYRTDLNGTVTVTTDGSTYTVTTQKSDTSSVIPTTESTGTNEVTPTETSISEPAKTQPTTSDTTDTSSASNYENLKPTSTTTSNTIDAGSGSIIANSNTNVYHSAGCRYVPKIKPEHLNYFNSQKEAESAGYRACKVCGGK